MEESSKIHKHSVEQGTDRDRLSELPDSVLLHILSFLDMQYVVPTSILSKRWRNLWKSVPDIDFQWLLPTSVHWPINFVEQSLSRREGSKIRKFRVCIQSDDYPAEQLNSWISVVARHTIEELHLDFSPSLGDELDTNDDRYVPPHCIYNCTSLASLTLSRCKIDLPPSMCLSSLKTLYLGRVDLADDVMRALISGCPLLEDLTLYDCNRCDDLNIFAENSRLKNLKIIEWDYLLNTDETKLGIFAPNLLSLDFVDHIPRKSYDLKSLLSLVVASFSFDGLLDQDCYKTTNFVELLDQIRHAKVVKLCSGCIVDLSIREIRGSSNSVFSSVSTLVLKTGLCIYELPGMIYMLRNFINLEVLIIDVEEGDESYKFEEHFQDNCEFDEIKWWKSLESFFSDMLHHIKTIKIRPIFMGSECTAQRIEAADIEDVEKQRNMITQKTKEEMVECILKGKGNLIGFIRILVENSAVLEKFTITTTHQSYYANLVFTF